MNGIISTVNILFLKDTYTHREVRVYVDYSALLIQKHAVLLAYRKKTKDNISMFSSEILK